MKKNTLNLFTDIFDENFSLFQIKNDFQTLKTNIKELEKTYLFEINVAGIKKENIEINVEDGYLIVNITHKDEFDKKEYNYLRKEMSYKTCRRKYYVGEIKEDQIKASLNDGILFISIPKEEDINNKKTIIIN